MEWLLKLDRTEVMLYATPVQILDLDNKYTADDAAALLVQGGPQFFASLPPGDKETLIKGSYQQRSAEDQRPPKEYWPKVKEEFYKLLCTDDAKYADLRKQLRDSAQVTAASAISAISAFIATQISVGAGSIVGLVAVCIYAAIKVGVEAYCAISAPL